MDDLAWLKSLQSELWPPPPPGPYRPPYDRRSRSVDPFKLEACRTLLPEELDRIFAAIPQHKLIAEMFMSGMFGGYGMRLYEHEPYPHTGAQFLVSIIEDHLPGPFGGEKPKKPPGAGRPDAWEVFSRFTHTAQNQEWLKRYKLQPSRESTYYDY